MRYLLVFGIGVSLFATAQAQTAAPAPQQLLDGPLIPGVCVLSRDGVLANAKVGQAVTARLRVLAQEAQAEINAERQPLEAEFTALQAESAKLTLAQRQAREQALTTRLQPVQAKATLRGQEIEATRTKALQRVSAEIQPVVVTAYGQRKCGLLIDRTAVIGGNMGNDLTQAVIQGLDARISTMTFNRETLPTAPAPTR